MSLDLYELIYRNYKLNENNIPDTDIYISESKKKSILNILGNINKNKSITRGEINFSEILCAFMPIFEEKTQKISYRYEYFLKNGKKDIDPIKLMERYRNFDINNLPLIEVAKLLGINIEKSNVLEEANGQFIPGKNKIILGTDYAPTFIHELAHAIDHFLGNSFENYHTDENIKGFDELVAEASTFVICKTYNILIDESHALHYLDNFSSININTSEFINRVSLICEYVKKCIEKITAHNKR